MKLDLRALALTSVSALVLSAGFALPALAVSSVIDVPPPKVSDYWVSVTRQEGGVLVFDGFAPDAKTRDSFAQTSNADINWLKLGSGAPAEYAAAVSFGLEAIQRLSESRFALRGSVLTISGVAASQADFIALRSSLAGKLPAGIILAKAEIQAPRVDRYTFSARRQPNGNTILSGSIPDPEIEQRILSMAGTRSSSMLRFASGEPLNFEAMLDTTMPLLALLAEGEIKLENGRWTLSGEPATASNARSIEAAFTSNHLAESGWSLALSEPRQADAQPYVWKAEKAASGNVTLTGSLPTEAMQRVLAARLGDGLSDRTTIAPSAPDGFITHALSAVDALNLLETGSVGFDGAKWYVEGDGEAAGATEVIRQNLAAPADAWTVTVDEPAAPAVASVANEQETSAQVANPADPALPESAAAAAEDEPSAVTAGDQVPEVTSEGAVPGMATEDHVSDLPANGDTSEVTAENSASDAAAPQPAPQVATTDAAAIERCRATLADLSAQNAILFRSGAAILAEGTGPALQAVATAVAQCPGVAIDVAGHTDADGEAAANLALSVARAEAVVTALVGLGVATERLYAVGFGESQPVADNGTPAGKAQNRRIVVSVHAD